MHPLTIRRLRTTGLGLLAGAAVYMAAGSAGAQSRPVAPDTLRPAKRDTGSVAIPLRDTIHVDSSRILNDSTLARAVPLPSRRKPPTDTLRAPFARAFVPAVPEPDSALRYDRSAIYGSGAITLLDFLERIPGVTGFRTGWLASPQIATYYGQPNRVRIFYDGVELEPLDPREGQAFDLSQIQLYTLEDVTIERAPEELRVHLRSWTTRSTVPGTRVDVTTGDQNTNGYRGYYARRFRNGAALQFAGQQFNTARSPYGGDADAVDLMLRYGVAHDGWSLDAYADRSHRRRSVIDTSDVYRTGADVPRLPELDFTRTLAYLRAAAGDPARGPWLQALASTEQFKETSPHGQTPGTRNAPAVSDMADTNVVHAQYVLTGGTGGGGLRLAGFGRVRLFEGEARTSYGARAGLDRARLQASASAEHDSRLAESKADASARLLLLPYLAVSGAYGHVVSTPASSYSPLFPAAPDFTTMRVEAELRLFRLWVGGGLVTRDTAVLPSVPVLGNEFIGPAAWRSVGRASGTFATLRGPLPFLRALQLDAWGVMWNRGDTLYTPHFQTRETLSIGTDFNHRFRRSGFRVFGEVEHEYRDIVVFPVAAADQTAGTTRALAPQTISTRVEIHILQADIFWQFRNTTRQYVYEVPGLLTPRGVNLYGVRWTFSN